jgi:adenosylmethionine-8-amino-7-oxononanoate aminotransferase
MAVSGIGLFTEAFQEALINVVRIPVPTKGNEEISKLALENAISENDVAAFIFEPLVLGAAGMVMYDAAELDKLLSICKKNNVFTIADEVMTGFGKTGKLFACDYLKNQPDMMCLSKSLTGGTIPMAITTFTQDIFDGFMSDNVNQALLHGHTFTANPTGCAAALASISLLEKPDTYENINRINTSHLEFEKHISKHSKVKSSRVLGVIFALEIQVSEKQSYYSNLRNQFYNYFIEKGIILRPVGNVIYILPSYIISEESLQQIYTTIEQALNEIQC